MNTETTTAQTIANQIGSKAFYMMGRPQLIADGNSLIFKPKGSTRINRIVITLTGLDLYDIQFTKFRGMEIKIVAEHSGIYAEMINKLIEKETGLYLSI